MICAKLLSMKKKETSTQGNISRAENYDITLMLWVKLCTVLNLTTLLGNTEDPTTILLLFDNI